MACSDVSAAVGAAAACGGPQISESDAASAVETLVMSGSPTDVRELQTLDTHREDAVIQDKNEGNVLSRGLRNW